jgi:NTE family protein
VDHYVYKGSATQRNPLIPLSLCSTNYNAKISFSSIIKGMSRKKVQQAKRQFKSEGRSTSEAFATSFGQDNPRHDHSRNVENVLVIQGGGSLGAFGCGVFKALTKKGIGIDIASGTSMGAVNAAIIAGSKSGSPEKDLENFWRELAESSYKVIPDFVFLGFDERTARVAPERVSSAGLNAALFGVPNMFLPRWLQFAAGSAESAVADAQRNPHGLLPQNWTYLYDHSPLGDTLDKYIDFAKLRPRELGGSEQVDTRVRLLITAVNVLTSEPILFDSSRNPIEKKHILASTAYPLYGFPWIKLGDDTFGWDGSLLDNTPLRHVIQASPRNDKNVYIVENYSRNIDELPSNMMEVLDRTRDIIFSDKTKMSIRMSRFITRQIKLIEDLYDIFETADHSRFESSKIKHIKNEYQKLVHEHGAEILSVARIVRDDASATHLLKNADFSPAEIIRLIKEGEQKTLEHLEGK